MRIIFYTDSDYFSGAERVFRLLAKRLKYDQGLLVINPKIKERFQEEGLPDNLELMPLASRSKLNLFLVGRFAGLIKKFRSDLCVVNMQTPFANTFLLLAARISGAKVMTIWHFAQERQNIRGPLTPLKLFAYKLAFQLSDQMVTVSHWHRQVLISQFGADEAKVSVALNGIEPPESFERKPNKADKVLLSVGTLEPSKGQEVLLQALASVKGGWKLVIVGDGPDRERLQILAKELGLEGKVSFEGYQAPASPYYPKSDLFVHPSLAENLSIAIIEALSFGLPVIAHRLGGNPELVTDGENGRLVEKNNVEGWTQTINELLQSPKLERFGRASRLRFEERFTLEKMIESYQALIGQYS